MNKINIISFCILIAVSSSGKRRNDEGMYDTAVIVTFQRIFHFYAAYVLRPRRHASALMSRHKIVYAVYCGINITPLLLQFLLHKLYLAWFCFFVARCYASAVCAVSVRPSVRLSVGQWVSVTFVYSVGIVWVLLEIYFSFQQWKDFENHLRTDKVMAMSFVYYFFGTQCISS